MWYIFPQMAGLGMSYTARLYSIADIDEARRYIGHPVLGERLIEISPRTFEAGILRRRRRQGYPDDLKLRSCAALFAQVSDDPVFKAVLDKFYGGRADTRTLELLGLELTDTDLLTGIR